jgi:hypothetical protein
MTLAIGTSAGRLVPEVSALAARVKEAVAALPTPVADALRLYALFGVLNRDLHAFAPAVKTTAEFRKLRADVIAGQTLAKTLNDALGQIHAQAQSVVGRVQTLQTDVMSLQSKLDTLLTATVNNAENTAQPRLHDSVQRLRARFAADIATAQHGVAGARNAAAGVAGFGRTAQKQLADAQARAHKSVTAAKASAHRAVTSGTDHAKRAIAHALSSARQKVTAAVLKVKQTLASVRAKARAALAAAKAKAKQGGQAALAAAQASADKAVAAAQKALTTANNDYADLLGINQQAVAWELPAGDATDVSEQEGSLIYTIAGT